MRNLPPADRNQSAARIQASDRDLIDLRHQAAEILVTPGQQAVGIRIARSD